MLTSVSDKLHTCLPTFYLRNETRALSETLCCVRNGEAQKISNAKYSDVQKTNNVQINPGACTPILNNAHTTRVVLC